MIRHWPISNRQRSGNRSMETPVRGVLLAGVFGCALRSLQRITQALTLQRCLLAMWEQAGEEQDGYVFEEIAECLYALGWVTESQPYFAQAYALLSRDYWLVAQEGTRVERLKQLSLPPDTNTAPF